MTAPAATSDAVRTSELRFFGGTGAVGRSAAARHARLVAAMAQTIPCCGMRMVVVVKCCQNSLARIIDLRAYAWERLLCRPSWESALLWCSGAVLPAVGDSSIGTRALQRAKCRA